MDTIIGIGLFSCIFCLVYFIICILYAGISSSFSWFWLLMGGVYFCTVMVLLYLKRENISVPHKLKTILICLFCACVLIFILIEFSILLYGHLKPRQKADYVIILGAQVNGTTISRSLKARLDQALIYLKENPKAIAVVTGGQGRHELVTEAYAMRLYLMGNGVSPNRILEENRSVSTHENLLYSGEIIGKNNSIVIVSNTFHIFRAVRLAKKLGFLQVQGLGAPTNKILAVSYYVRESLAVVKDVIMGKM